jgi:hypothetical protein
VSPAFHYTSSLATASKHAASVRPATHRNAPRVSTDLYIAALSDPGSSSDEDIPPRKEGKAAKPEPVQLDEEEQTDNNDDDEEEGEDE